MQPRLGRQRYKSSPVDVDGYKHRKARPKNTLNSPTQLRNTGRDYQVMEVHLENRSEIQSVGYDRYDVQALGSYGMNRPSAQGEKHK